MQSGGELQHILACRGPRLDPAYWDDMVDRLAAHGVTYLAGGSIDAGVVSPYRGPRDVDLALLIRDLAQAPEPRLRDALIALLLLHPEYTSAVYAFRSALAADDTTRLWLDGRLLAAAALQRLWQDALAHYLVPQPLIDVVGLLAEYDLPAPEVEGGRALLCAAGRLLAGTRPVDYVGGWEDVARHVLRELQWTAPVSAG